jgi:hypothetical protein
MTKLLWLLLFIPTVCLAQKSTVFDAGVNVRLLKDNLVFKNRVTKIMSSDTDSPNSVAKSAGIGSLYMELDTGHWWWKSDSGSSTNWTRLPYGDTGGNLLLAPAGATELIFDLQGGQQYAMGADGSNALYIQSQTAATPSSLFLFSEDGDASDFVNFAIYGSGSPDGANEHFSVLQWDATNIQYELQTGAGGTGAEQDLSIFAGAGNLNQLFLDQSSGNVSIKGSGPSSSLDVNGAIEQSGLELTAKNLLVNGSFEDGASGVFTVTTGQVNDETTNVLYGATAADVDDNTAGSIDIEACVTNAQWEGRQVEVGCYVKSTLSDISLCFNDGTNDDTCNTSYDGSDAWKYVFQRGTPGAGEDMCLHITSPSAGTVELDNCVIKEPEFSTAELADAPKTYTESNGDFTVTGTNWTTGHATIMPYKTGDGQWRATFNIAGSVTPDATNLTLTVSGLTFSNTAGNQAVASNKGSNQSTARTTPNTGDIGIFGAATGGSFRVSGDVELEDKPTWADDLDVNTNVITRAQQDQPTIISDGTTQSILDSTVTKVSFGADYDPDANWDATSDEWTADRSGIVNAKCQVRFEFNATGRREVRIYKNGAVEKINSMDAPDLNQPHVQVDATVNVSKGDTLDCRVLQNSGLGAPGLNIATSGNSTFASFHYVDSKALLAGLEDSNVYLSAYMSASQTITGTETLEIDTIDKDPQGSFNTGTYTYTIPESGNYAAKLGVKFQSNSGAILGEKASCYLYVNGSNVQELIRYEQPASGTGALIYKVHGEFNRFMAQGDQVRVDCDETMTNDISVTGNANLNAATYLQIIKEQSISTGADFVEKFQRKTLGAPLIADANAITWSNLEAGKCYEAFAKVLFESSANSGSGCSILHNGVTLARVQKNPDAGTDTQSQTGAMAAPFIATTTTLELYCSGLAANDSVQGNGTFSETYMNLTEKNCTETSQW